MKTARIICIIAPAILSACESEIDMDYRRINPLYVVEGSITTSGCEVAVTTTRDMDKPEASAPVEVDAVIITAANGENAMLTCGSNGIYTSTALTGIEGVTYTLSITVNGEAFTSTSTMPGQIKIVSTNMHRAERMGSEMLYLDVDVAAHSRDINYYYYRVERNGELFKWNVEKNNNPASGKIALSINLMNLEKAEKNDPDDHDSILYENDEISVEVRAIDIRAYDYLFSAKLSAQNSTNPVENFTDPSVAGYFSAYTSDTETFRFRYSDISE